MPIIWIQMNVALQNKGTDLGLRFSRSREL